MAKVITFLCFFGMMANLLAQPLTEVDQMPYFPGCDNFKEGSTKKRDCSNKGVVSFISSYLEYPEAAKFEKVEGTVYVSFVVDKNGQVNNPTILRDIGSGCGDAALEVLQKMPTWEPGIHQGDKVDVKLNIPVRFSFTGEDATSEEPPYKIHWGGLKTNQVTRSQLIENSQNPVQVRDLFGNEIQIGELLFTYEKKRRYLDAKSNGRLDKKMKKVIKKARKGGDFAVIATIQKDGEFVYVERVFSVY